MNGSLVNVARCAALGLALLVALGGCASVGQQEDHAAEVAAYLAAGSDFERRGDSNGALVQYVKALGLDERNAEAHFRVARVHRGLDNRQTAKEAYQRALACDAQHLGALEEYGVLLLEDGQNSAAKTVLERAVAADASRWPAQNALGVLADLAGDHATAQAHFQRALVHQPLRAELLNNMGYSLYLAQDYAAAQRFFEQAIAVQPDSTHAWSNLGLVLARRERYPDAVEALARVMDLPSAYYSAAYICMLEGRLPAAEKLLLSAIRSSPSYHAAAHSALLRVQRSNGDEAEAASFELKSLPVAPTKPLAQAQPVAPRPPLVKLVETPVLGSRK